MDGRDAAQAAALLAEAASTMGADLIMGGGSPGDTAAAQVMGRHGGHHGASLGEYCHRVFPWKATPSSRNARWTTAWRPRAFLCPLSWPPSRGWPSRATPRCATSCRRGDVAPRCVPWPTLPRRAEPTTVTVVSRELKPGRSGGRIVAGEAPEAVAETVRLLAEEAKVL